MGIQILEYLTSHNFKETYSFINDIRVTYGLSLLDLIKRIDKFIFNLELDEIQLCELICDLSKIEHNLSNEQIRSRLSDLASEF